jgi:phosphatidylserine/phosphatidylglycerophosphate/cardiolipin synthase-like enzyme
MEGMKTFEATDPGFPAGSTYSTEDQPIQSFQWADYSAKPGHSYVYTVAALKGSPENLTVFKDVAVEIGTESPEGDVNDVYFNRGVAASQAYARRFGNRRPEDVQNRKAFEWLSRGLFEAMTDFVSAGADADHGFRVAAYEFHYKPFLQSLKAALDNDADVEIVYDARKEPLATKNADAVAASGLAGVATPRTKNRSSISHNKFIVRLRNGEPEAVWTGGTNFSEGGIFGHSNVGQVVEDADIARLYLRYWELLKADPASGDLRPEVDALTPIPTNPPPRGVSVVFSPRGSLDALNRYAEIALTAREGLFMTFAFGMNDLWKDVYRRSPAPLRFALLEKKTRAMEAGQEREAEERAIDVLRRLPQNVFAIGSFITTNRLDGWLKEKLTGLNSNVKFVHNKFMLVDPLGNDPIVIAGSANFSQASTDENDENMLVIRGNKRVADIYLGEFMRLYSHHAFRESLTFNRDPNEPVKFLSTGDWWRDYFGATPRSARREFFA